MPTYYPATQTEIDAALAAFYSGAPIPNGFAVNLTWSEKVRRVDPDAPAPAWPGWFSDFVPGAGEIVVGAVDGTPQKVKRGLLDPEPGVARLSQAIQVMATPPTVGTTHVFAGGSSPNPTNSAITNAKRFLTTETTAFRYYRGTVTSYAADWRVPMVKANYLTSANSAPSFNVDFEVDCSQIEILVGDLNEKLYVLVDGQFISLTPITAGGTGGIMGIPLTFASRGIHRITIITPYFWGVMVGPNDTIWPSSFPLGPRVIVLGDSFTEGTGATNTGYEVEGFVPQLGYLMGWRDIWMSGSGGTGYLNPGTSGRVKFRDRVQSDVIAPNPEIVIVAGGINDNGYASASAVGTEASALYAAIRAGLPHARLIVVGPWYPSGSPPQAIVQIRDAIKTAATGVADLFIDNIKGPVPWSGTAGDYTNTGWMTGTGKVGATTGTGNADLYTSSDGTHPTTAGHAFLARRLAHAISAAMPL